MFNLSPEVLLSVIPQLQEELTVSFFYTLLFYYYYYYYYYFIYIKTRRDFKFN